jgi:ATP-dependent Zn protease
MGIMLRAMRASFAEAQKKAPAILFIDEVDSFPDRGTARPERSDWDTAVVNALLAEIDGVGRLEGVVVIAACNHPEKLDPALLRSGRLERHIRVRTSDAHAIERILREHLGDDLVGQPLAQAALMLDGCSGADCERAVKGARRRARGAGRPMLLGDLLAEIGGAERSEAERAVVSLHEAGHAVAACVLAPGALRSAALRSGGGAEGGCVVEWPDRIVTSAWVRLRLVYLLSGRAAEDVVLGQATAGAGGGPGSDLALATALAAQAAAGFGFDPVAGLLWADARSTAPLQDVLGRDRLIARQVRAALADAYAEAVALIRTRIQAVIAVAAALRERRALDGASVYAIVEAVG